jgi:hypothetical protein
MIGPRSEMMRIAALCERGQWTRVEETSSPAEKAIAVGVRRAAAPGGGLPGAKLSALLRQDGYWSEFERLGHEPNEKHKLPRGRRRAGDTASKTLAQLDKAASALLKAAPSHARKTEYPMSYDFDAVKGRQAPEVSTPIPDRRDLAGIVMLLELAAIYLSPTPDSTFTVKQLIEQAQAIGGNEIAIEEKDAAIVLKKSSFLKKLSGGLLKLK